PCRADHGDRCGGDAACGHRVAAWRRAYRRALRCPPNATNAPAHALPVRRGRSLHKSGGDLLSRGVSPQVPSALAVFTSVFGMGTGVSPPLLPPEIWFAPSRSGDNRCSSAAELTRTPRT